MLARAIARGFAAVAAVLGLTAAEAAPDPVPACLGPGATETVARIGPGRDIVTKAGRTLRLADLRLPDDDAPGDLGAEVDARLAELIGGAVTVRAAGSPDRWGRQPAAIDADGLDVARALVAAGLAVLDAGERDGICRTDLQSAEAEARAARAGAWARWPLPATDAAAIVGLAGRFVLIEGRVESVGERRDRTYLNFGRDYARDAAIVIPKRSWARLKAAGATAPVLTGRTVLARGIVEVRRAPSIEILSPAMLSWGADR